MGSIVDSQERARLEALRSYGVLDTPPEERFDRLVRLVGSRLGVPISLISLVDVERQWFKARLGLDAEETPRDVAFCDHAIRDDRTLVVPNALEDPRFAANPLVVGQPNIRFYAGAPLITKSGYRLGTLCAIDREPRSLTPDEDDFLRQLSAIAIDELELTAIQRSLEARNAEIGERNQTLDAFAHALSHDLAGPIRRIGGFCELLQADPSSIPECLRHIEQSAKSAGALLDDLRAYLLVDRVEESLACDARSCLDAALETLGDDLRESAASVEAPATLPRLPVPAGLFTSVLTNLISNAIKYRAARPLVIRIDAREDGDGAEIAVCDNGIGIAPESQQRVFDPLFRLHRDAEIPGSGLGLAICRKILQRFGGSIRLESEVDRGTRALVRVPRLA